MKKTFLQFLFINLIFIHSITFAGNTVPFTYNVLPNDANESIIGKEQKSISFRLFEPEGDIFCNGDKIDVVDNEFSINISNLSGKQEFVLSNSMNQEILYTYYISDENGYVSDYLLAPIKNLKVYVQTIDNVKIIYTNKDSNKINTIIKYLQSMPECTKINLSQITLMPVKHTSGAAGITLGNKITLYNISKYSSKTVQNIVFHEITHTWASKLIQLKDLDFSYTKYSEAVKLDKKYVSTYSKNAIKQKEDYSEDFADSVAFYLMNSKSFTKKFPNRTNLIKELMK